MYGGATNANKAAGHEVKSLNALFPVMLSKESKMRAPLMTCVDYRGVRITAMTLLPINSETLVLGSNDGGKTMHDADMEGSREAEICCSALNLAPHRINGTLCFGPGDLEVHRFVSLLNFFILFFFFFVFTLLFFSYLFIVVVLMIEYMFWTLLGYFLRNLNLIKAQTKERFFINYYGLNF